MANPLNVNINVKLLFQELTNLEEIYICEFCLKYLKSRKCLERHLVSDIYYTDGTITFHLPEYMYFLITLWTIIFISRMTNVPWDTLLEMRSTEKETFPSLKLTGGKIKWVILIPYIHFDSFDSCYRCVQMNDLMREISLHLNASFSIGCSRIMPRTSAC